MKEFENNICLAYNHQSRPVAKRRLIFANNSINYERFGPFGVYQCDRYRCGLFVKWIENIIWSKKKKNGRKQ